MIDARTRRGSPNAGRLRDTIDEKGADRVGSGKAQINGRSGCRQVEIFAIGQDRVFKTKPAIAAGRGTKDVRVAPPAAERVHDHELAIAVLGRLKGPVTGFSS